MFFFTDFSKNGINSKFEEQPTLDSSYYMEMNYYNSKRYADQQDIKISASVDEDFLRNGSLKPVHFDDVERVITWEGIINPRKLKWDGERSINIDIDYYIFYHDIKSQAHLYPVIIDPKTGEATQDFDDAFGNSEMEVSGHSLKILMRGFNGDNTAFKIQFKTEVGGLSKKEYSAKMTHTASQNRFINEAHHVNGDNHSELYISSIASTNDPIYQYQVLDWNMSVNKANWQLNDVKVNSYINGKSKIITNSIKVSRLQVVDGIKTYVSVDPSEYVLSLEEKRNQKGDEYHRLGIEFDKINREYLIEFQTMAYEVGGLTSQIDIQSNYVNEQEMQIHQNVSDPLLPDGTYVYDGEAIIQILDSVGSVIPQNSMYELYYKINDDKVLFGKLNAIAGQLDVGNLPNGTYYLKEVDGPIGYDQNPTEHEFTVDDNSK